MSTRGNIGFHLDGKDFLCYNHSDSYPEWLGASMLKQARQISKMSRDKVKLAVATLEPLSEPPTAEQISRCSKAGAVNLDVSGQKVTDPYCLTRNIQGDLLAHLRLGLMNFNNGFMADSLFCEWAYVINLDDGTLEVYKGFNKAPNGKGRYAQLRNDEYYGVSLVIAYPLNKLPTKPRFLKDVEALTKEPSEVAA